MLDFDRMLLDRIEFLHDPVENHWGETHGDTIWINTHKEFTSDLLYYTILYETLHGMIRRSDNHELSELAEHRMMHTINSNLI